MKRIVDRKTLISALKAYQPFNEQEFKDKCEILRRLESGEELTLRENASAQLTASAWVINRDMTKVLMAYHNLYDSWAWLGGHVDGSYDLLNVALREVKEESGLTTVEPVFEGIYSVEILTVDGHEKKGEYVSSHLHLNLTFLLMGDEEESLRSKPDENQDVAWFTLEEALKRSSEPWFVERIYKKLNQKLINCKENPSSYEEM
ncbi:MAG: NUDIX hydrolase [bacterium]